MDGEQDAGDASRLDRAASTAAPSAAPSPKSSTRATDASSSIFRFHPARQQPPLQLAKKASTTPRALTPRNLVFPESSDALKELPVAEERAFASLHDSGGANQETMHRRGVTQQANIPTSARKYLSPCTPAGDDNDNDGDRDVDAAAPNQHHHGHHHHHHHHKRPHTAAAVVPRSVHGKLQFYSSRFVQSARRSLRGTRQTYRHLTFQQKSAFMLILFGMLSESATPAPRYNVPLGIGIFMHPTSRLDHRIVVSGLCLAILVDFAWLLRPQEGSFNGFFQVQYDNFMHACLGVCALVKVWLVFSTYADLGPEPPSAGSTPAQATGVDQATQPPQRPHHPVWHHIKFFFPRKTLPRSSHLSFEVLMRSLALIWIHGICGVALLVLGVVSAMFYTGRVQFRSMAFGAPLHLMMIFRSATTLASYIVATQHMNYNGCLKLFGCHRLAEYDQDGGSDIVLKYNRRWLKRVQRAKALDTLVGVYFLLVFYSAFHSGQFFAGSGLTAVLVLTALLVLVLDFWTPLLLMVVAKCGSALHAHHKRGTVDVDPYYPNQLEWEEEDDDDEADADASSSSAASSSSDSDGSSSSGSESDDAFYSSSWSSSDSSGGYSTTDSRIRRRRRRNLQRRRHKMKKRELRRQRSSSRRSLLERESSLPIVNADEVDSGRGRGGVFENGGGGGGQLRAINSSRGSENSNGRSGSNGSGVWVRHWHEASGRSFLVHSITGESVWEIVSVQKTGSGASNAHDQQQQQQNTPLSARKYPSTSALASGAASSSARRQSSDKGLSSSGGHSVAAPGSPPTSDSEIVVTSVHSPRGAPGAGGGNGSARLSARRSFASAGDPAGELQADAAVDPYPSSELLLTPDEFLQLWDALPDGGSFICRVSRIPNTHDLARHLQRNRFLVASDGLNSANLRTVHFYAAVVDASEMQQFFLGEFAFDSLSLKLFAKFRCPQQDAIVPCVKKLQLKEIVGSYAPCE